MSDLFSNFDEISASFARALKAANQANKSALFPILEAAGITTVTVAFDGEGDSGQIESVSAFVDNQPAKLPKRIITLHRVSWPDQTHSEPRDVREAIEALCYGYLEQEHGGWENNDGAFGEFTLHVRERRVEMEFNQRLQDSALFCHTF